jgi:hypothetical protein
LHTWFDGFRTLKLVHGLRAAGFASIPWRLALSDARLALDPDPVGSTPEALRVALLNKERQLPPLIGPTLEG